MQPLKIPPTAPDAGRTARDTEHSALETRRWLEQSFPAQARGPADAKDPTARGTAADADPLLAFGSEQEPPAHHLTAPIPLALGTRPRTLKSLGMASLAVATIAVLGLGGLQIVRLRAAQQQTAAGRPGKVTIASRPAGAEVIIDGRLEGRTPLALTLNPGGHSMTIRLNGMERDVPLSVPPGAEVTQYLEISGAALHVPAAETGRVSVMTDPVGARVAVDGRSVGVSPVTVENLSASEHRISVTTEAGTVYRSVTVTPGATASVVFSLAKTSPSPTIGGWIAIESAFDVQLLERGEVVGASGIAKIMLAAGRHDLLLVNSALDFQESRRVDVVADKVTVLRVVPPKAALSVNARPWADVSIDGGGVGQTPLANFLVPIGTHEVTFRHPQLGERRQSVVVTTKGPNRVGVDLTK